MFWPAEAAKARRALDRAILLNHRIIQCPAAMVRQSVRLVPFAQSRKILVTGSKRGRDMVRDLLADLDREAGNQTMRVFQLQFADAEEVATDIEQLYGGKKDTGGYGYFSDYFSSR